MKTPLEKLQEHGKLTLVGEFKPWPPHRAKGKTRFAYCKMDYSLSPAECDAWLERVRRIPWPERESSIMTREDEGEIRPYCERIPELLEFISELRYQICVGSAAYKREQETLQRIADNERQARYEEEKKRRRQIRTRELYALRKAERRVTMTLMPIEEEKIA